MLHQMDRKIEKKRFTPLKIAIYSIGGLLALFFLYVLILESSVSRLNVEREKITVAEVQTGLFQEYIPETGTVIPITTVYLDALEGGRVEERYVEAGTMIEAGEPILLLGNTNLLLDIMFREAEFFDAANNLRNTRLLMEQNRLRLKADLIDLDYEIRKLERQKVRQTELYENQLISEQEFEDFTDDFEYQSLRRELAIQSFRQDSLFRSVQIKQLEASLQRMEGNLSVSKQKLDNLTLRAPISGQLTSLNAEIGESKAQGERLGQIDVVNGFKVRAAVDEHYLPRIDVGQQGHFEFVGQSYQLAIRKIFPEINNGQFDVDLEFVGETPEGVRRGQTLHIKLQLGDLSEATMVDRGGFYQKTGGQWVYVVDPSGEFAVRRNIRLGRRNPQQFEVLEGLSPGEKVVVSSYDNFGDKDRLVLK